MISTTKLSALADRTGRLADRLADRQADRSARWGVLGALVMAGSILGPSALIPSTAQAQAQQANDGYYGAADQYTGVPVEGQEPPIPPYVEGQAIAADGGGGYCYVGPHPVDTRVVPGPAFEDVQGQHIRPYPPVDLRLFSFRDGCYYFIGDPRDFGYSGQSYSYYGAHPVLDTYGGGWCFMMGGHYHLWQPWSPYFTVVGPWYYWYGPYDPFFWSYWPYYSFYYRSYYPNYYAGGRFYRGGAYRSAPPIQRVPATGWRGTPPGSAAGVAGGGFRGAPPSSSSAAPGGWRNSPPAAGGASAAAPWRGMPQSGGAAGVAPFRAPSTPSASPGGGWRGSPAPSFSAPRGGGFSSPGGGSFRGSPGGGTFRGGRR